MICSASAGVNRMGPPSTHTVWMVLAPRLDLRPVPGVTQCWPDNCGFVGEQLPVSREANESFVIHDEVDCDDEPSNAATASANWLEL